MITNNNEIIEVVPDLKEIAKSFSAKEMLNLLKIKLKI